MALRFQSQLWRLFDGLGSRSSVIGYIPAHRPNRSTAEQFFSLVCIAGHTLIETLRGLERFFYAEIVIPSSCANLAYAEVYARYDAC